MAIETNRYAEQRQQVTGPDPRWRPTTADEMRAYVGMNVMMGVKQLPRIWCYWSTDKRYGDPFISGVMPKTRFLKLNQYIHLRDTSDMPGRDDPDYDPLYKVRPLLDLVSKKFRKVYKPARDLSVDEAMIGFKGRVHFRQYMPAKPTKWGVKVWEVCESDTGYCSNFDVYTGRKPGGRQHGLGYDVVWNITKPFHNKNHHLYYDRFFSSVLLAEHLDMVSTYVCGTIMQNRKGLPAEIASAKLKNNGELLQMQKGNMIATSYKDKRQLTFLSTSQQPFQGQGKPTCNLNYNSHMGGVDKSDQMRTYYPVGRAGKKWWRYLLWFVINLSIVNAHIVYTKSEKDPAPKKGYDHLAFRVDVAEQLIAGYTCRKHKAGKRVALANQVVAPETIGHHKLEKISGRKKICKECSVQKRRTPKGRHIETSFFCVFCDVPLCRNGCFAAYHHRNMMT
ncbi:piggyBac transposable element-derived protein 4-like [Argopecten irradians]|uniref:piggyBac transposable element-derived protein 4-like n=1 Tax=Argopecten irradians TaxID=31199 RepID=UPI003716EE89